MVHTFDIHFGRAAGSLRWRGPGRLRIDGEGIRIAAGRGIARLFAGSRRIAASDLRGVTREGAALRIDYASGGADHAMPPFRARDRDTAERIVRSLPTRQTVEFDDEAEVCFETAPRKDWRVNAALGVAICAVGMAALTVWQFRKARTIPNPPAALAQPATATASSKIASPPAAGNVTPGETGIGTPGELPVGPKQPIRALVASPASASNPELGAVEDAGAPDTEIGGADAPTLRAATAHGPAGDQIVPFDFGTPEQDVARRALESFFRDALELLKSQPRASSLATAEYLNALADLEQRWWELTFRTLDRRDLVRRELRGFRRALLATARHHRASVLYSADALRTGQPRYEDLADEEISAAQAAFDRARAYVQ